MPKNRVDKPRLFGARDSLRIINRLINYRVLRGLWTIDQLINAHAEDIKYFAGDSPDGDSGDLLNQIINQAIIFQDAENNVSGPLRFFCPPKKTRQRLDDIAFFGVGPRQNIGGEGTCG